MSLVDNIVAAQNRAEAVRPAVGGFPYLAEALREAGVIHIAVTVPSWTTVFTTAAGSVIQQGAPMTEGISAVPAFDRDAFITGLRADQDGRSTFGEFMAATWRAGITHYEVDLVGRTCTYHAPGGDIYLEEYPQIDLQAVSAGTVRA